MATTDDHFRMAPGELSRKMEIVEDALEQIRLVGVPLELTQQWREVIIESLSSRRIRYGGIARRCYVAFYGKDGKATHMKIGIAKTPIKRLKGLDTASPHTRLWSFQSAVMSDGVARDAERQLLAFFGPKRATGEWVSVEAHDFNEAACIVSTLEHECGLTFDQIQ